jgi:small subunit ribosomal protein S6e
MGGIKLNIANPSTGGQKLLEIEDDKKLRTLYDKRLAAEVDGEELGDEFKGYVFKIVGGQDKQGFSMHQGVLTTDRVRLMMSKGEAGCRGYGMRKGERYRKSVRGCIISHNTAVLHMVVVKKGAEDIPGLTDSLIPRRLGPKRASKIRKLFALTKDDDVRKYVIRREVPAKSDDKKPSSKAPKIQRLVTPISQQRKRHRMSVKKARQLKTKTEAADYQKLCAQRQKESREKRAEKLSQRKSQRSSRAED